MAGIHFNTFGLTDNHKQSSKMVFVGAGVTVDRSETAACPEGFWNLKIQMLDRSDFSDKLEYNLGLIYKFLFTNVFTFRDWKKGSYLN